MDNKQSLLDNLVDYITFHKSMKSLTVEDIEAIRKDILNILDFNSGNKVTEVKLYSEYNNVPEYKTSGAACMDIKAVINKKVFNVDNKAVECKLMINDKGIDFVSLLPGGRCVINTGLYPELPDSHKFTIKPRSGESIKSGLTVHLGTIDSDYRGEIGIICQNNTNDTIYIHDGDRIAQLELEKVDKVRWKLVASRSLLSNTDRGEGGYGSTGK